MVVMRGRKYLVDISGSNVSAFVEAILDVYGLCSVESVSGAVEAVASGIYDNMVVPCEEDVEVVVRRSGDAVEILIYGLEDDDDYA